MLYEHLERLNNIKSDSKRVQMLKRAVESLIDKEKRKLREDE